MKSEPKGRRRWPLFLTIVLFATLAAGLVSQLSAVVPVPDAVLVPAALVGVLGLAVFFVVGVRLARRSGSGVVRSVGRALWAVVRGAFDLF